MSHSYASLILVLSALASGCGATDARPATTPISAATVAVSGPPTAPATPTVVIATVTPIPTVSRAPILSWNVPPKSGVAHVDAIVAALTTGNANALAPYVTGQVMTCRENDAPYCPPGVPSNSPVPGLITGTCPGDTTPVTLFDGPSSTASPRRHETPLGWSSRIVGTGPLYLIGIYGPHRASNPTAYALEPVYRITIGTGDRLAQAGWVIGLDDRGIVENIYARSDCLRRYGMSMVLVSPP